MLQRLLQRKFSDLPLWVPEKLSKANAQQLEVWGDRILDANTLEEIFKQHH
ncbi:DUF4351 domain-containing protein [Magnetococcales bacterium HHB-1]